MRSLVCAALGLALVAPVWAINKCTGADGKVVFQDAPCIQGARAEELTVRPASGRAPRAQPAVAGDPVSGASKPQTEAERIDAQVAASQKSRRKRELEERWVPDAQADIERSQAQCDKQLKELQAKKSSANNNLAGATYLASLANEMSAVTTQCDTKNRDLNKTLDSLRSECQSLGGCP